MQTCVVPPSPARGKEEMNKGPHAMGGGVLAPGFSLSLPPPTAFPPTSPISWGLVGSKRVHALKLGLEISKGFFFCGGGGMWCEEKAVNRTLVPAINGFTHKQRQLQYHFLKVKVKVRGGREKAMFGETPLL